jgi:hypothetical protein
MIVILCDIWDKCGILVVTRCTYLRMKFMEHIGFLCSGDLVHMHNLIIDFRVRGNLHVSPLS